MTLEGYKKSVAERVAYASQDGFLDPLPEMFKSIVVLDITIDREGRLASVSVRRSNGYQALESRALESVRRASPFGAPAFAVRVLGDPEALRRLVDNLVVNAVTYTPADGYVHVDLAAHDAHRPPFADPVRHREDPDRGDADHRREQELDAAHREICVEHVRHRHERDQEARCVDRYCKRDSPVASTTAHDAARGQEDQQH